VIDVDLQLTVTDGARRFDLAARFATDVPFAALYGPSGAGKSLTFQAIAGLLHPDNGHVRLDGRTLFDSAQRIDVAASATSAICSELHAVSSLGADNIAFADFGAIGACQGQRWVDALLHGFDLVAMADSRPRTLSAASSGAYRSGPRPDRRCCCGRTLCALTPCCAAPCARSGACAASGTSRSVVTHDIDDVLELACLSPDRPGRASPARRHEPRPRGATTRYFVIEGRNLLRDYVAS
jgi:molybdate transport system ATP-binding protein